MKVGTKSVLFGAHCFFIHPWFVAAAWAKLYGFPFDPRLWVAFFVHDLGYWGKPNMDGPEGERHVEFGAFIMHVLFDWKCVGRLQGKRGYFKVYRNIWGKFSLYHSRFYAKKDGAKPSKLCFADKLAICLEPAWLYLFRVNLSGEIHEYLKNGQQNAANWAPVYGQKEWHKQLVDYMRKWVFEHLDGKDDKWTLNRH